MSYLSRRIRVVKNPDGSIKSEVEQYYAITSYWLKDQKKRTKTQVYIGRKSSKNGYTFNEKALKWSELFKGTDIESAFNEFAKQYASPNCQNTSDTE